VEVQILFRGYFVQQKTLKRYTCPHLHRAFGFAHMSGQQSQMTKTHTVDHRHKL
jgi:hypothetical protein